MIQRILFVMSFILVSPILVICIYISLFVLGPVFLIIYFIKGDKEDKLQGYLIAPSEWIMNLPWKLTGIEL